jgi:hypothetical protein
MTETVLTDPRDLSDLPTLLFFVLIASSVFLVNIVYDER